jgi:hypothetical protein
MSTCFVCLDPARRKVCPSCECYAHSSCWGKYLASVASIRTTVGPEYVVIYTPWSAPCPQCRGRIMGVKPRTRSDTDHARRLAVIIDYATFLTALDLVENNEEKLELCADVLDLMTANKIIVRRNDTLTTLLKHSLRTLYVEDGWLAANLYHLELFGMQITGSQ